MIKVLQVCPGLNRGGLETFVMNVYRNIDRRIVQFDFLTNLDSGDYFEEIKELGGNIYYVPGRNKGYKKYLRNLNDFFRLHRNEYRAVHYHESSLTSLEVLYFAKKSGIPTRIMHSHNSSIMGNKLHYITHYVGKLCIGNLATHYFGCSDKALDWMYGGSGVRHKAVLINNGIDTGKFAFNAETRNKVRKTLNLREEHLVVGHIGRFSRVKNHSFLLMIFKELKAIHPNAKLLLVGNGELLSEVQHQANALDITEDVIHLGVRSDIPDLLQAMDVFVMPSLYEGLPVVMVETQTAGLPIICSDTISTMSYLTEHVYPISLEVSPREWAKCIADATTGYERIDCSAIISARGFDIGVIAGKLTKTYIG